MIFFNGNVYLKIYKIKTKFFNFYKNNQKNLIFSYKEFVLFLNLANLGFFFFFLGFFLEVLVFLFLFYQG
jgi:hypothetical protein